MMDNYGNEICDKWWKERDRLEMKLVRKRNKLERVEKERRECWKDSNCYGGWELNEKYRKVNKEFDTIENEYKRFLTKGVRYNNNIKKKKDSK